MGVCINYGRMSQGIFQVQSSSFHLDNLDNGFLSIKEIVINKTGTNQLIFLVHYPKALSIYSEKPTLKPTVLIRLDLLTQE